MGKESIQLKATEDNCVYFYDTQALRWRKECDIETPEQLPLSIIKQVRELKQQAASLPDV